jgi:hypothetical protein
VWQLSPGTVLDEEAVVHLRWDRPQTEGLEPIKELAMSAKVLKNGLPIAVTPKPGAKTARASGVIELRICDEATKRTCIPVRRPVELDFAIEPSQGLKLGEHSAPVAEVVVVLPAVH